MKVDGNETGRSARVLAALVDARTVLDSVIADEDLHTAIARAGAAFSRALRSRRRIFSCGNGGSLCDAVHFAEELSGRYRLDRPALAAISMADPAHMSCVANDYGYEHVFSRFLEAHAEAGDCLLAISTSGKSPNVLQAARAAKDRGVTVVGLTGNRDSALGTLSDIEIATVGGRFADRVQEVHIKVIHILIELIEAELFPELR
jgi:D-sedoheptulose 7-phosphate isomerase